MSNRADYQSLAGAPSLILHCSPLNINNTTGKNAITLVENDLNGLGPEQKQLHTYHIVAKMKKDH